MQIRIKKIEDLREGGALSPDGAIVAEDSGSGEGTTTADIAHKVVVHVGLPRHLSIFRLVFAAAAVLLEWTEILGRKS